MPYIRVPTGLIETLFIAQQAFLQIGQIGMPYTCVPTGLIVTLYGAEERS